MRTATSALGIALSAACSRAPGPLTAAHASAIEDSVRTTLNELLRYSAAGQWDSMLAIYDDTPGFRWVEQGAVVAKSVADIRRGFAKMPPGMRVVTTVHDPAIAAVSPGAASVLTGFETRMVDSSGTGFSFGGILTLVMVHRASGWKILTGQSSSPTPSTSAPSRPTP